MIDGVQNDNIVLDGAWLHQDGVIPDVVMGDVDLEENASGAEDESPENETCDDEISVVIDAGVDDEVLDCTTDELEPLISTESGPGAVVVVTGVFVWTAVLSKALLPPAV